jgi:hypothetical protein
MAEIANPKVILKKKQVPTVVDYCLEESIEFSVKQQSFPDTDWEIEIKLKDFKAAVLLGMFLRENRIEIDGIEPQRYKRPAKKSDEKPEASSKSSSSSKEEKHKHESTSEGESAESSESTEPTLM